MASRIGRLSMAVSSQLRSHIVVTGFEQAVEELVGNSLDAGATMVRVEFERGGACENGGRCCLLELVGSWQESPQESVSRESSGECQPAQHVPGHVGRVSQASRKSKAGDSSAEELSSVTQLARALLPIVKPRPTAEIVSISDEMKAQKGYYKLRQERMNERLVGIRKKAEAAEKEDKK